MQQTNNCLSLTRQTPSQAHSPRSESAQYTLSNRIQQNYDAILSRQEQSRSKSRRKLRKVKTPSEILKDNILKNKKSKKLIDLKKITEQNLKLFRRLQEQKSSYQFSALHRHNSCSLLSIVKPNFNSDQGSVKNRRCSAQQGSRCTLTISLKKSRPLTASNGSESHPIIPIKNSNAFEKATPMIVNLDSKVNKENIERNFIKNSCEIGSKQQQILEKKAGIKLPMDKIKFGNNKIFSLKNSKVQLPLSFRSQAVMPDEKRGFLTERKIAINV